MDYGYLSTEYTLYEQEGPQLELLHSTLAMSYTICGAILGDSEPFQITIGSNESVFNLKERIKQANAPERDSLATRNITLYLVNIDISNAYDEVISELAGHGGLVWAGPFAEPPPGAAAGGRFAWEYLERVHGTIGAGANEVQRDSIARFALRLPRRR